jgi:transcriptional regulator with XRE-family HTH domain
MSRKRVRPDTIPEIARRLRLLRMAVADSQAEFCRRAGISTQSWNNYERALGRINVDTAMALQRRFGVSLDWIYLGSEASIEQLPKGLAEKMERIERELEAGEAEQAKG